MYGYCPTCGAEGVSRERRINGNDTCKNGCVYPSSRALDYAPAFFQLSKEFLIPTLVNQLASAFGGTILDKEHLFFKQDVVPDPPRLKEGYSQSYDDRFYTDQLTTKLFYIAVGKKLVVCVNYQTSTGASVAVTVLKILQDNEWTLAPAGS
jgi:hypothetical protein